MTLRHRSLLLALVSCFLLPASRADAQDGVIRGVVTDTAGRPLAGVEVVALTTKRSTRTDASGRYALANLPVGEQLMMARLPGYLRSERIVTLVAEGAVALDFRLDRVAQALDTVRVTSRDTCEPYDFAGYECRQRAGVGQFRGPEELRVLRPTYFADLFDGMTGLRRTPVRLDVTVVSTTGWRCIATGWNGRQRTAADRLVLPRDIAAIEYYATYDLVPEAYKRLAWPKSSGKPCSLVMYWTHSYIEHADRQKARKPKG